MLAYETNEQGEEIPVATGRLIFLENWFKIGRIAVKKECRGKHYGDFVVRMLLDKAFSMGAKEVFVGAQAHAISFYERIGFVKQEEEYYEETMYDNDQLSEMLKDITDRYSELDFSDNSDIDKKVELIKDIEILIDDETKKGEGLNSKNADIRQIFVELQNIVDDMKNAL